MTQAATFVLVFVVLLTVALIMNLVIAVASGADTIDKNHFTISACLVATKANQIVGAVMFLLTAPFLIAGTFVNYKKGIMARNNLVLSIFVLSVISALLFVAVPFVSVQVHPRIHCVISGLMFFLIGVWTTLVVVQEQGQKRKSTRLARLGLCIAYWLVFVSLVVSSSQSTSVATDPKSDSEASFVSGLSEYLDVAILVGFMGTLGKDW